VEYYEALEMLLGLGVLRGMRLHLPPSRDGSAAELRVMAAVNSRNSFSYPSNICGKAGNTGVRGTEGGFVRLKSRRRRLGALNL
jgi:hypothetical protein